MKLSKREKILLAVLGMLLFWYLTVQFAIMPLISQMQAADSEMERLTQQGEQMDLFLSRFSDADANLAEQEELMAAENYFFRDIDDVFVGRTLLELAAKHNVEIPNLEIEPKLVAETLPYESSAAPLSYPIRQQYLTVMDSAEPNAPIQTGETVQLPRFRATAIVRGKMEDVAALAGEIGELSKSVVVVSVGSGASENIVDGNFSDTMVIDFYYLDSSVEKQSTELDG